MSRKAVVLAVVLAVFAAAPSAFALKCATGLRSAKEGRINPAPPLSRSVPRSFGRVTAPVPFENGSALLTEHFQIVWGNDYNAQDPGWSDADTDGVPEWIEVIAEAMEYSYAKFASLGYPPPYGVEDYYLDVYIGNTGLRLYDSDAGSFQEMTINPGYYAYTEIDTEFSVAFFVFGADYSRYTDNELEVLKAVCAHELFHAVQRGAGYPWNAEGPDDGPDYISYQRWMQEGWWLEASATWMEEEAYPEINDYANYVISFLAIPWQALYQFDGSHEYGASIFTGYVRMMSPGQETLLGILNEAYPEGLENSLRKYIGLYAGDTLEDSVAKFWSLAAHPADKWPDGALYVSSIYGAPKISAEVFTAPFDFTPPAGKAPKRFGANLFSMDTSMLPEKAVLEPEDPAWELTLAVSGSGSSTASIPDLSSPLEPPSGGTTTWAAVVNTSPEAGSAYYKFTLGEPSEEGGSSGGGCFLETLCFPAGR